VETSKLGAGLFVGAALIALCGRADAEPSSESSSARAPAAASLAPAHETHFSVHDFRVIDSESGPENYYEVFDEPNPRESFIHAGYRPPMETMTMALRFPDRMHHGVKKIRWTWRAVAIPRGANDCVDGKGDSAAIVYVSFKNGLKWYTLKYVWADAGATKGQSCAQKDNLFVRQDAIVRESGGPTNRWITEEIDPTADFRKYFANNNPHADVPDLAGVAIMSDGDQTRSISSADYRDFTVIE
jgi:hypothetical protein